jgi:hypothetical protein
VPAAELAVVTRQGRVFGLFPREDAERVARWLRNHGNADVRVTIAAIESWGPIPQPEACRIEVRNPIGAAPTLHVWTLNNSLTGEPQWERREDGRLAGTTGTAALREATERWLDDGYRIAQYRY